MKNWFSAQEIADFRVGILPTTKVNVIKRAKKEGWEFRKRSARGGGFEYAFSSLPLEAQEEIKARQTAALLKETASEALPAVATAIAPQEAPTALTMRQRQIESGRLGVLQAVERLIEQSGCTKAAAITTILVQAQSGDHPELMTLFNMARDTRGTGARSTKLPSLRTVDRWFSERNSGGSLAPSVRQAANYLPAWGAAFLRCYQVPMKPSVQQAYDWFAAEYEGDLPSIHQVRRFVNDRLGAIQRNKGRMGKKALADIDLFKRRSINNLKAGDVYIADGHTFDAEVISPVTGQPCRPEITAIKDVGTDMIVAAVASFAESALSTVSAIKQSCVEYGVGAIFYTDNGSGFLADELTNESLGLLSRLGMTHAKSRPYNAKAKGKIERVHKAVFVPLAKTYATFVGADMDPQAAQHVFKLTRKDLSQGIKPALMPDWDQFCSDIKAAVAAYNNAPNSAQPKIIDASGKRRHMTPNERWAADLEAGHGPQKMDLPEDVLTFYPQLERTIRRGEVEFGSKRYYASALREYHGERLPVAYDPADSQFLWVYDHDQRLICKAERDGNNTDYMSDSEIARAQDKRQQAALKRNDAKRINILGDGRQEAIEGDTVIDMGNLTVDLKELTRRGDEALARITVNDDKPSAMGHVFDMDDIENEDSTPLHTHPWQRRMPPEERYQLYLQTLADEHRPLEASLWMERYEQSHEFTVMQDQFNQDAQESNG